MVLEKKLAYLFFEINGKTKCAIAGSIAFMQTLQPIWEMRAGHLAPMKCKTGGT